MSENGLRKLVKGWAGNEDDAKDWMDELGKQKIRDMKALIERSEYEDQWKKFLGEVSSGLGTKLKKWYDTSDDTKDIREQKKVSAGVDYSRYFYWSRTLASPPFDLERALEQATFYISSFASTVYGIKQVKKSYYMAKYASTSDEVFAIDGMLSEVERKYANRKISSFRARGLGFIFAPILFVTWKLIFRNDRSHSQ